MKYTKGPWRICYDGQIDSNRGKFICSFRWDSYKEFNDNKEAQANAHLIASAPEMLEALKAIMSDGTVAYDWMAKMAEKAIAKTEGKKQ